METVTFARCLVCSTVMDPPTPLAPWSMPRVSPVPGSMRHPALRSPKPLTATACDVPLASTFGPNTLERFKVWTDEVAGP